MCPPCLGVSKGSQRSAAVAIEEEKEVPGEAVGRLPKDLISRTPLAPGWDADWKLYGQVLRRTGSPMPQSFVKGSVENSSSTGFPSRQWSFRVRTCAGARWEREHWFKCSCRCRAGGFGRSDLQERTVLTRFVCSSSSHFPSNFGWGRMFERCRERYVCRRRALRTVRQALDPPPTPKQASRLPKLPKLEYHVPSLAMGPPVTRQSPGGGNWTA
jgi:hypothetical protein